MLRNISIAAVVLLAVFVVSCSSSGEADSQETPSPELADAVDLSGLNADETEAEIIRLLGDGHIMYTRMRIFPGVRIPELPCLTAQVVCDTYPDVTVFEAWETANPSGIRNGTFVRRSKEDGSVLATAIEGEWTDLATGERWGIPTEPGSDFFAFIRDSFTKIERERERGLEIVEGEILGRPSVVIPSGEFEYQIANPLIQRQTRWQDDGNGGREMVSELRVLEFAILPPGALPGFAVEAS